MPLRRIAVVACLVVTAASCSGEQDSLPPATSTTTTTSTPNTTTTSAPPDSTTTTTQPAVAQPPWAQPALDPTILSPVLQEEWGSAENRESCAALYPDGATSLAAGATVRGAAFAGGWGVAWDLDSGPGRNPDGTYCEDCGRGVFGVAGVPVEGADPPFPNQLEWSDGSFALYGVEGNADPGSGAPWLAFLDVSGQACLYNVWSFLGENHLLAVLSSLRFVDDLGVGFTDEEGTTTTTVGGDAAEAPWDANASLAADAVPALIRTDYENELAAKEGCPLLVPAALPAAGGGTRLRDATNAGELLVAWDQPDGPGRYPTGEFCADCGRGAMVVGTLSGGIGDTAARPVRTTYADGTQLRIVDEGELLGGGPFVDPETGEPVDPFLRAYLTIPGFSCAYQVWSALGEEHLLALVDELRRVEGYAG